VIISSPYLELFLLRDRFNYISVCTRAKHGHRSLVTGRSDPTGFGRLKAVQCGVAPGLLSVLPACILAVLLLASRYSSGVSRCPWVNPNLKAGLKVGWSLFFTGVVFFCGFGFVGLDSKRAV
jgi:hypothetical protein